LEIGIRLVVVVISLKFLGVLGSKWL
jgi:hypothetical protein